MKGLDTLIKLHKRELDTLRRRMGLLENQKIKLQQVSQALRDELESELKQAESHPEMAGFFAGFSKRIQNRQEQIYKEILGIDQEMQALSDKIMDSYIELKKFEVAKENHLRQKQEEEARKLNIAMDEIANQQFTRKQPN